MARKHVEFVGGQTSENVDELEERIQLVLDEYHEWELTHVIPVGSPVMMVMLFFKKSE